jgi:hypothetical protein
MMRKPIWVGFVSVIVLAFICAGIHALTERGDVAEATLSEVDTIIGVDANTTGNTATSLGTINGCISVNSTDSFSIDVFVEDVTNLNSFDGTFRFDGTILEVTDVDVQQFLATAPESSVTSYSGSVPNHSGSFLVNAMDYGEAPESGEGILARLEITPRGPAGISKANFDLRPDGYPISGVQLFDQYGNAIGDLDEDDYFDGVALSAEIRVDEPCPGECLPDVDTDGDGFDDDVECYLPTDQLDACPDDPSDDAWPLDINRSADISVTGDVFSFVGRIGAKSGPSVYCPGPLQGNWWQRLDLNMSCDISVSGDVFKYVGHVGQHCS